MELKYGNKETYKYDLDKEELELLSNETKRSNSQTLFLFQLVEGDLEKLKQLEAQLKACFVFYCPDTKEEVKAVLKMDPKR